MKDAYDPIRILYLDDSGREGPLRPVRLKGGGSLLVPALDDSPPESYFDVRWIATAVEAREFKDRTRVAASMFSRTPAEALWIPEIICFDYALTQNLTPVEERLRNVGDDGSAYSSISPLPAVRALVTQRLDAGEEEPAPTPTGGVGNDVSGCYVGGALLSAFADHPCAPVPFTRHMVVKGSDAEFFEWLIKREIDFNFEEKGGKWDQWSDILQLALPVLRDRLKTLAHEGRVAVSLPDLLHLAHPADPAATDQLSIHFQSRFGSRRLPVAALWADWSDHSRRTQEAQIWAQDFIEKMSPMSNRATGGGTLLRMAHGEAERIWDAYCDNELVSSRAELSQLVGMERRGSQENERLEILQRHFGVHDDACLENCPNLHDSPLPPRAKRWAALLIMARLTVRWVLTYKDQIMLGRTALPQLTGFDVLLALNPSPSKPLHMYFHHAETDAARNAWAKKLKRLKDRNIPIGLRIQKVLEREDPLLPGEATLLRNYVLGLNFDSSLWPEHCFWESVNHD